MNEWLERLLFSLLVLPAFGFFTYRLQHTWKLLHSLAKGKEEAQQETNFPLVRFGVWQKLDP